MSASLMTCPRCHLRHAPTTIVDSSEGKDSAEPTPRAFFAAQPPRFVFAAAAAYRRQEPPAAAAAVGMSGCITPSLEKATPPTSQLTPPGGARQMRLTCAV